MQDAVQNRLKWPSILGLVRFCRVSWLGNGGWRFAPIDAAPLLPLVLILRQPSGGVTERPIVQHWKCCVGETPPGVRIPPPPLFII